MDRSNIEKIAHTPEDRLLLAKLWDISLGLRRDIPANTCFLSPREQEMARYLFGQEPGLQFFGGYKDAERQMLCYLPEYLALPDAGSVCMALPRRKRAYESESLFPYFESILPEGDFARRVCREGLLDRDDRFGMLLALAHTDALGDVTVVERRDEA